jgi:hypothetical protein
MYEKDINFSQSLSRQFFGSQTINGEVDRPESTIFRSAAAD